MTDMIKKYLAIFSVAAMALFSSCQKEEWPAQPDWSKIPDSSQPSDDGLRKPEKATNNIVAHRGGSAECSLPDNSIASLQYAMQQGCFASECDIYWTKDDNVVVAHADGNCKINGLYPWEATLAEIRAAGKLSNGEQVPCLEDFIKEVMKDGSCTKLWLDIKNITKPSTLTQYPINATRRACEIVEEMGAQHFVEFICTGNQTVMTAAYGYAFDAGLPIGWMGNQAASVFVKKAYPWANFSAASVMSPLSGGTGARTLAEFMDAGIELSVYNVDKKAGDGNAVYSEAAVDYYVTNALKFKALCTNYPAWLIGKVEEATKTWDGIRSYKDWTDFIKEVAKDPSASRFANASGEVVLHIDVEHSGNWTPIADFTGVFNGNGKTVTINCESSAASVALFAKVSGTVKNLTVAGSIKGGTAEGTAYIAGVAANLAENAVITGCTNKAKIEVKLDAAAASQYVGGIYACGAAGNVVENNTNEGAVEVYIKDAKNVNVIGGIAGYSYSSMKNCKNTARISYKDEVNNTKGTYMGGVIARLQVSKGYVLDGCVNEGEVIMNTVQVANSWLGGIAANAEAENLTETAEKILNKFVNCENKGAVISDNPADATEKCRTRLGGLCGGFVALEGCTNSGLVKINQGPAKATEYPIGGLCGIGGKGTWKNCKQLGDVVNNLGKANLLAHTGGMAGWVLGNLVIENCAIDANVSSNILYNYDKDKGKGDDLTHKNSSCAGMICGRINKGFTVTVKDTKLYGSLTRTINKNGETETTEFKSSVPADSYLYGALQDATAKFSASGLTCAKSK